MKQGWEIKTLGDLCLIISGQSPESKHYNTNGNGMPFYQGKKEFTDKYIGKPTTWTTDVTKIAEPLDILISVRAPVGDVNYATEKICIGRGLAAIRVGKTLNNDYLFYYLLSIQDKINGKDGAVFPSINRKDIESLNIPLCSPSWQERIVGILDSAFAKIEALRANVQQNLQNTKDLFQASIDKAYAIPAESRSISSVAKVINGYAFSSNDFKPTNSVKSIKITNVGVGEFIEESDNYLPAEYVDSLQDSQVSSGDIVIALTRTIISAGLKVAVVPDCYNGALVNQRVAALVSLQGVMSREYLYNFLLTTRVKNYVLAHVNTLMQPNLSITDLKNMDVPYLPYEEQKVVASKIDALSERCRAMEENYRQTIAHCNALKQALLTKAFNGEL